MINGLDSNNYYVDIYNTVGKKELSNINIKLNANKINTSQLSSGTYFLEIKNQKFEDILFKKVLIY